MTLQLDLWTMTLASALVILVAGITFIADTLARRDDIAGRVWALGYLAGMLTVVSYLFWAADPSAWWATAVGNTTFVASTGCLWVGNRAYNQRPGFWWLSVVLVSLTAGAAVVIAGPSGGDWAGALIMFAAIAIFAGLGGVEAFRGALGANPNARGLGGVMLFASAFYIARSTVFLVAGPDSSAFQVWFGSISNSIVTITLVIVAAITMSALRAERTRLRSWRRGRPEDAASLSVPVLAQIAQEWLSRPAAATARVAVLAIRLDGLAAIRTAFGRFEADELCTDWSDSVRRLAPQGALVAEEAPGSLVVLWTVENVDEALADARDIADGLLAPGGRDIGGIRPTATLGVAVALEGAADADDVMDAARTAADEALEAGEGVRLSATSDR